MLLPLLSPELQNFITFLLFLNLFTRSKLMRDFYTKFSLLYKTLHPCRPSYLHSLLSLKRNCLTRSSSLVTLNRPCNNSNLKITIGLFITLLLLYRTVPLLTYVILSSHSTSQAKLNLPLFSFSPSVFLKSIKTHLFHL
jgi:hypothetical protein